jgi:hypothetical protein
MGHILITSILSALFYFPGMIYAFMLIDDVICPNSVELFTNIKYKKIRHVFSYGDYNMRDKRLQEMNTCKTWKDLGKEFKQESSAFDELGTESGWVSGGNDDPKFIPYGEAIVGSIRVGANVKVILYEDNHFTSEIGTIEYDTDNAYTKLGTSNNSKLRSCGKNIKGNNLENVVIRAISVRLKKEEKRTELIPKEIDDNSVIFYLLMDFRGQHLILKEGHYDYDEITKLFHNRISSIRLGKNMKIRIFQHKQYNRKSLLSASAKIPGTDKYKRTYTSWVSTHGLEADLYGNRKYDNENDGEITNLSNVKRDKGDQEITWNNTISSMIICKIDDEGKDCWVGGSHGEDN